MSQDRSRSRGRVQEITASGRGGYGNMSPVRAIKENENETSLPRGRDPRSQNSEEIHYTGRGGAGNIARSQSRNARTDNAAYEEERRVTREYEAKDHPHATGRGGAGNFPSDRSRSRPRAPESHVHHTTGRGGLGNTYEGERPSRVEESVVPSGRASDVEGYHSTGRGGLGNTEKGNRTFSPERPEHPISRPAETTYRSSGRGGAGNFN